MNTPIEFSFTLDKRFIKHLREKSYYNHNYYELWLAPYGDYIVSEKCNVLYEECHDDMTGAYYSLGYFDDTGNFKACWTWFEEKDKNLWELRQ